MVLFTLPITALCVAIIRLVERARKRKLWWDDALAGLCAIMLLIFIVTTSLFTNPAAMRMCTLSKFPSMMEILTVLFIQLVCHNRPGYPYTICK